MTAAISKIDDYSAQQSSIQNKHVKNLPQITQKTKLTKLIAFDNNLRQEQSVKIPKESTFQNLDVFKIQGGVLLT